jgi:hypothetical protein
MPWLHRTSTLDNGKRTVSERVFDPADFGAAASSVVLRLTKVAGAKAATRLNDANKTAMTFMVMIDENEC